MALKGTKAEKPAFEQEPVGDTAVAEKPAADAKPAETAPQPAATVNEAAAAAETTTAITKASNSAVSTADAANKAKGFQKEVEAMRGAFDFSYGNFSVYKGNNGEIVSGDEESLGRWAKVRMLGWDDHYEVSPGEQSSSSKDFVAYSKDGKTVDSVIGEEQREWVGKPVDEYVNHLKTVEDFENADCRRFIDIACAVLGADNGDAAGVGKVVQVTLSQSSIPAFSKYQESLKTTARCVEMGLPGFALPEDPFTFFFIRELASKGSNKWTKLRIEATLPNKL
jgi:hypothetical protein